MKRALMLLVVAAGCGGGPSHPGTKELENRNWLDMWPTEKDDHLEVYRFTPAMGGGVYQDRTVFKGTFELFTYEIHGDEIRFTLPHTGEHVTSHFRIDRVDGPKPFDLRLTLDHPPRGPHVFYGRSAEKSAADVDLELAGSFR
jgi:hypothetical protein